LLPVPAAWYIQANVMRTSALFLLLALASLLPARQASAQYKNKSFGFDLAGWLITKPDITDSDGQVIESADKRPLRLANGARLGGETSFKLDEDHWWATFRVNVAALQFAAGDKKGDFDSVAKEKLGTLLGVQGMMGFRYVIFTDKVRPYLQLSLSYLRLFSFASAAGDSCEGVLGLPYCNSGTYQDNFLPHPNVGGVHGVGGVEFIFTRDIAINVFLDFQRWIIFNAADNNSFALGAGIIFYT
jgi:hypothetical protein